MCFLIEIVTMGQGSYDIDTVLDEIGEFGRYQFLTFTLLCIPMFFNAIFTLSYVFTASSVDQRCWIKNCDQGNDLYLPPWINNSVPIENGVPARCSRYESRNSSAVDEFECTADLFNRSNVVQCNEFVYKNEERTIATEVCPLIILTKTI